jgi:hypothetical protein
MVSVCGFAMSPANSRFYMNDSCLRVSIGLYLAHTRMRQYIAENGEPPSKKGKGKGGGGGKGGDGGNQV